MALPIVWIAHIRDPETKANFERAVRASGTALDRLREILGQKLDALERELFSDEFLEKPNLDQRAYVNLGEMKQVRELISILTFSKAMTE